MAGSDRTISVLRLFTIETPAQSVEQVARTLDVSVSSAYRYMAALTEAGLLTPSAGGRYVLGPAIIELDRQIQLTDPLLHAAKPVMAELVRFAPPGSSVLLCRLFRETVLCVHREIAPGPAGTVSYERGRPMPLFRGATSKVILASFATRDLARLYKARSEAIAAEGLGGNLEEFRRAMTAIRKAGHALSRGEVDKGMFGIAAPIVGEGDRVYGSLSYVVAEREAAQAPHLITLVMGGAGRIEESLRAG